ncbi:MAG: hypothetical protein U9P90_03835 [Patescibacteria group bacterium]|nr:hypothetical protein [Patescibacteria group bacterium]
MAKAISPISEIIIKPHPDERRVRKFFFLKMKKDQKIHDSLGLVKDGKQIKTLLGSISENDCSEQTWEIIVKKYWTFGGKHFSNKLMSKFIGAIHMVEAKTSDVFSKKEKEAQLKRWNETGRTQKSEIFSREPIDVWIGLRTKNKNINIDKDKINLFLI